MPVKYFYVFVAILSWKVDKVLIEVVIQSLAAAPQSGILTITKSGTITGTFSKDFFSQGAVI